MQVGVLSGNKSDLSSEDWLGTFNFEPSSLRSTAWTRSTDLVINEDFGVSKSVSAAVSTVEHSDSVN